MSLEFFRLYNFKGNIQFSLKENLFASFVWMQFQVLIALRNTAKSESSFMSAHRTIHMEYLSCNWGDIHVISCFIHTETCPYIPIFVEVGQKYKTPCMTSYVNF